MFSNASKLFTTVCFLLVISPVFAIVTVSIVSEFPSNEHICVIICITDYSDDLGSALHCDTPLANDCFCNTASATASLASSWFAACGSSKCSAGDVSDDITAMHSIYASYCIGAGFTQPGATDWYSPASTTANVGSSATPSTTANPGQTATSGPAQTATSSPAQTATSSPAQTATSGPAQTTTELTVVTQTAPSTSGSVATQPQVVTVQTTSTLLVSPAGSPVAESSDSGPNKLALGIGLGVGIFVVLVVMAVGLWFCLRRRHVGRRARADQPLPPMTMPQQAAPEPVLSFASATEPSLIPRKAVRVHSLSPQPQTAEMTGEGVRRELSAREANPFPSPISPGSSASMRGNYEMSGEDRARELPGQPSSPPPEYTHMVAHQLAHQAELDGQAQRQVRDPRWELP